MPKEKVKIKAIKAVVEVEAQMFGIFAVHPTSFKEGAKEHKTFTLTHAPSGYSLVKACPFKSLAIKVAKLLDQHLKNRAFGSDVISSNVEKVRASFPQDCRAFIFKINNRMMEATKAGSVDVDKIWNESVAIPDVATASQGDLF